MAEAIKQAKLGQGKTFTNPLVGAVIVQNDQIIACGAHLKFGEPHAENNAILSCKSPEKLLNSTLYVTLESCNHHGKQPPCTDLILKSGIKQVVIAQLDPNPLVAGSGKEKLERHGIEVITGILEIEARALNPFYNFYFETGRPFITLKQAVTLDGKLALFKKRTAITGQETSRFVHAERGRYQGILVGSETVLLDNPTLLAADECVFQPSQIVLDRRGRTLARDDLDIFQNQRSPVLVFTEKKVRQSLLPEHVEVIQQDQVSVASVVRELKERKLQSIYVEGGARIHDAFLASGYWDEVISYLSPTLIGGNGTASFTSSREVADVTLVGDLSVEQIGQDIRISGRRC